MADSDTALADTAGIDTLTKDTTFLPDSLARRAGQVDSLSRDSLRRAGENKVQPRAAKSQIESPIAYTAKDSLTFNVDQKRMILYEEATVNYEDFEIQSAEVKVDYDKTEISAYGERDSNFKLTKTPVFKENDDTYLAETMRYNYSSRKGRIRYAYTKQDLDIIQGDVIMRNPDNSFYIKDGRFSSCDCEGDQTIISSPKRSKSSPTTRSSPGPRCCISWTYPRR